MDDAIRSLDIGFNDLCIVNGYGSGRIKSRLGSLNRLRHHFLSRKVLDITFPGTT
jgi:hypothetical protein